MNAKVKVNKIRSTTTYLSGKELKYNGLNVISQQYNPKGVGSVQNLVWKGVIQNRFMTPILIHDPFYVNTPKLCAAIVVVLQIHEICCG